VFKYGKVLIQKINASIWFRHKEEEEELDGRYLKENNRRRGCTLVGIPKGTSYR